MMKKYNKPEIVTLALESVDVIETSGTEAAAAGLNNTEGFQDANVVLVKQQISSMNQQWHW